MQYTTAHEKAQAFLQIFGFHFPGGGRNETFGEATEPPRKKRGNTAKFLLTQGDFFIIICEYAAERTASAPRDRDEPGDCSKEVTSGEYVR